MKHTGSNSMSKSKGNLFDTVNTCVHKEYSITRQMRGKKRALREYSHVQNPVNFA